MEKVKLNLLEESEDNPRQIKNSEGDKDLKRSIEAKGLLTPLLVRKHGKKYQILAGHRRYSACKALGYKEVPVTIADVNRAEGKEIMVIENLQRVDVHPMEEARAFQELYEKLETQKLPPAECIKSVAKKMGKTIPYITQNIVLCQLHIKIANLFLKGIITKPIALVYAKMTHDDQLSVLDNNLVTWPTSHHKTIEDLKRHIDAFKTRLMSEIIWTVDDEFEGLVACNACPKNTGVNTDLFGTSTKKDARCTDRECFNTKKRKHLSKMRSSAKAGWDICFDFHEGAIEYAWSNSDPQISIKGGSVKANELKNKSFSYKNKKDLKDPFPVYVKSHNTDHWNTDIKSLLGKTIFIENPYDENGIAPGPRRDVEGDHEEKWKQDRIAREKRAIKELLMLDYSINETQKVKTGHFNEIGDLFCERIAKALFGDASYGKGVRVLALFGEGKGETFWERYAFLENEGWDEYNLGRTDLIAKIAKQGLKGLHKLDLVINALSDYDSIHGGEGAKYSKENSIKCFVSEICDLDFKKVSRAVQKETKQIYDGTKEE